MYIYVSFTSAELKDRRVLQNSWTEIELNLSRTAVKEKWRTMLDQFPLVDTLFNGHPNTEDEGEYVVSEGWSI